MRIVFLLSFLLMLSACGRESNSSPSCKLSYEQCQVGHN